MASANRRQPTHSPSPRLLTPQNSTRAYFSHSLGRFCDARPPMTFSRHHLAQRATLDAVDLAEVQGCRRAHNQLGFAYQVGFVRLLNSCLTLIVACIIYWQAKDISRVIRTADPERHGIELSLLRHVSPIEWDNIVLYGEYVLNRRLVRRSGSRP